MKKKMIKVCECGCGEFPKKGNRFIDRHQGRAFGRLGKFGWKGKDLKLGFTYCKGENRWGIISRKGSIIKWSRIVKENELFNKLGEYFSLAGYEIHHLDKNTVNDSLDNLIVLTKRQHSSLHMRGRVLTKETKLKMSLSAQKMWDKEIKRRTVSDKVKEKISLGMKGKIFSFEHKKKIGLSNKGKVRSKEAREKVSDGIKNWWKIRKEKEVMLGEEDIM